MKSFTKNYSVISIQMRKLFFFIVIAGSVSRISAYPISPLTLMKLIETSEVIVIAKVNNPNRVTKFYDEKSKDTLLQLSFGGDGLADLNVIEILKGKCASSVSVAYEPNMICPAPPHYPDGETVLAFLYYDKKSAKYVTCGLSYGSKIMRNSSETNAYKRRIEEYRHIQSIRDRQTRENSIVEWLVKCSVNEYTRWEGVYELNRAGDFMSFYDQTKDAGYAGRLNQVQLRRLDSAFFATDTLQYADMCLAGLIHSSRKVELQRKLSSNLPFARMYIAEEIMKAIIKINPDKQLQAIIAELDTISYDDNERESKTKAIAMKYYKRVLELK